MKPEDELELRLLKKEVEILKKQLEANVKVVCDQIRRVGKICDRIYLLESENKKV